MFYKTKAACNFWGSLCPALRSPVVSHVLCRWNNREVNEMGKDSSSAAWHSFITCFQVSGTAGLKKSRAACRSGVCWSRGEEQQSGLTNSCMSSQLGREPATKRCQPSEATWHGTLKELWRAGTGGARPGGTGSGACSGQKGRQMVFPNGKGQGQG